MTMTDASAPPTTDPPTDDRPADEHDRPTVEVVDREQAPPAPVPAVREKGTLELATEAALANPSIAGRDEFLMLATTARILSMSAGAPAAVRNNPWLAFHLALVGRDLGISPSAALQLIDVIGYDTSKPNDYDKVQLSLSPELLNGQIRRLGLGSIVPGERTDEACEAIALTPERERLGSATFTWAEAKQAGLVDDRCAPFAHWTKDGVPPGDAWKNENKCRCRQGWRTYPRRMLWWRAAGYCAADYFPEAGLGLYSPEELGAVVDEAGRPIDPGNVELPDGYERTLPPPPPSEDFVFGDDAAENLTKRRNDLHNRLGAVKAVPPAAEALRVLWAERDDENYRKTPPWEHLDFRRRHFTRAEAVVKSVEDRIKRGEWGEEAKQAWGEATTSSAGFGTGRGAQPTAEDFQAGTGKSPHELARERLAREQQAVTGDPEAGDPPESGEDRPDEAETDAPADGDQPTPEVAPAVTEDHSGSEDPDGGAIGAARTTCGTCHEPFKVSASGKNSPGPLGRDEKEPGYHRSCAAELPF